jgi:single-stranded-DNA-specific exonuclease
MKKAVERICEAMHKNEKILIYGDYDVDGITSVAMVYLFFKKELNYDKIVFYIPDRFKEGYGLSKNGIDYAIENKIPLIITLDCGIKSFNQIAYAQSNGIDIIVCDHHLPDENTPCAYAILNPKLRNCPYPFKELSGCGIGFKLLHALSLALGISEDSLKSYLDLVCLSTCADIVPIIDENRFFVSEGLKKIENSTRLGIRALLKIAGLEGKKLDVNSVVFGLAPRINASGRLEHASTSVELLISDVEQDAYNIALKINQINNDRKNYHENITNEVLLMIKNDEELEKSFSTVVFNSDWNKGVIGIVASKCIEYYYRPTIILTESDGVATGSARSIEGFDIYKAIECCREHLLQFGGHAHAAGLTLELNRILDFKKSFENFTRNFLKNKRPQPTLWYDAVLNLDDISANFFNLLKRFSPFGPGNEEPLFVAQNLEVVDKVNVLKDKHLKFYVKQCNGQVMFEAVAFNLVEKIHLLSKKFSLCFHLHENHFNFQSKIQLIVKDIKEF